MSRATIEKIPLRPFSSGKFAYVNRMDYKRALKLAKSWYLHKSNGVDYTEYARAEIYDNKKRSRVYLHRLVMNATANDKVDHINGDGLNCTRNNLRFCSLSENAANRKSLQKNNTSGFNGVGWSKAKNKWRAYVQFQSKYIHLGYFVDPLEAAKAYNDKATELFGDFARLNKL